MKTTEIVDVVSVNNVTWTEGLETMRGAKQGVEQLLADQDKGGLVFVTTSKEACSPSK